jgi:membrane protein implicated in regulation of membrane protease activity
MYLIAIAWAYVALMMAAAEAMSPQGTLFGAFITLMLYGVLPLGLLLYILGTPGRRRRRAAQDSAQADAGGHAAPGPAERLPAEREEA